MVLTGRHANQRLIRGAYPVSEIVGIKQPFQRGIKRGRGFGYRMV
ncbi:MAG: cob(I)yrinic acid a,c-diamide adenosyltransferase [Dehalococcoidia bacterium]|nr:cob(I)yrinic acid a,c-diamide adenosyltransferase [Dehalococcoidia bacterium]